MIKRKENEQLLRDKFQRIFPGGHSNKKIIPSEMRILVSRAQGTRFWDLDGTEYIDYASALGPNILGHRHPEYVSSLKELIDSTALCVGGATGFTENDVVAAEKLIRHVPCAEAVKFTASGTEAVQTALRIARSYTGRPYVLMFEDHYHGWIDNITGLKLKPDQDGKPFAGAGEEILGRAPSAEDSTLMIEWNNIEVLENTFKNCGDEIALVIMEVFTGLEGRPPRPGYLQRVRELCDQYGVVLCFDEVLTGFRAGLNCAQGVFEVTPDITTLGKAIGGGMPISAVVGKYEMMDVLKKTSCPGTYMGHSLCVQGMVTSLGILERDNGAVYLQMEKVQRKLMSGLGEIAKRRGIPLRVQGFTGLFNTLFGGDPDTIRYSKYDGPDIDRDMSFKFWQFMHEQGIMCIWDLWYLNIMHTDQDTEVALEAADKAMSKL